MRSFQKKQGAFALAILLTAGCGSDGADSMSDTEAEGNLDAGPCTGCTSDDDTSPAQSSCRRIDLLFSVDPSGSMKEELAAMSQVVFPAFASALREVGGGLEDYRVAVIDGCPTPAGFHTRGDDTDSCDFQSGAPWMTSASSMLTDEFACVGDVWRDNECTGVNDDEQVIASAVASLSGANPGFLRDDALLVIVAITDEDECPDHPSCDDKSIERTGELYRDLVDIKGDVQRMVFLGIGGGPGGCDADEGVYGKAREAKLLGQVTQRFKDEGRGVAWDLCDGKLEDGLTEAIMVIDQACRELPQVD